MPTWLLRFDKQGLCVSPATRDASLATTNAGNDVILFSHGWQTRFDDAVSLYQKFLSAFEAVRRTYRRPDHAFVFVGVTWPSDWHLFRDGPRLAADGPGNDDLDIAIVLEGMAAALAPPLAARLYELGARVSVGEGEAEELARLLLAAQAPGVDDETGAGASDVAVEDFLTAWRAAEDDRGTGGSPLGKPGVATMDEGGPATAGMFSWLNPMRALSLASLLQMKDRAGRVGSTGVAALLAALLDRGARVHVVGHSFGAKVVLSATKAAGRMTPKVSSMVLLQPAVSRLSFAAALPDGRGPAGYAEIPDLVSMPVISTFSGHDGPLRNFYHLALRRQTDIGDVRTAAESESPFLALGGYGPAESESHHTAALPAAGEAFEIPEGVRVIGFDGSADKRIAGHGDVASNDLAWLVSEAIDRADPSPR